ncbi:hypothetical protein NW762_002317 [Fusarium torreyae]|uniref:Uncharacterized protein n=1 Tax=Fusarium torreyae TaxID=1237075 RepID=A0A9W8SAJ0_9HYPO|nr:hypothetical protein NW762_002317 [Fusarium torreyae]
MKVPVTPERRERASRAAAPSNLKEIDDSDEDPSPLSSLTEPPSSMATAIPIVDDDEKYEHSSTDSVTSIPAANNKALPSAAINRDLSPSKRAFGENEGGSPTKKSRKITIKTSSKKSTEDNDASTQTVSPVQALTPLSTQAVALSQSPSASVPGSHQAIHDNLTSIQEHVAIAIQENQVGLSLEQAKEKIAFLEQQLQAALSSQDSQLGLKQCEEKLKRTLQSEINLRKEKDDLRKEYDDLKSYNIELRVDMAKMIDEQEPHMNDSFKITDDQADFEWRRIAFEIRNFVSQVCTFNPHRVSAPKGADHHQVDAFKKNRKRCPELSDFYFQEYIWQRLVHDVFQAKAGVWGGPVGRAFNRFCLDISEVNFRDMRELSRMKAHTADLLSKNSNAENNAEMKKLTLSMHADMFIWMDPNQAGQAGERLWEIVRRAVALNTSFMKSRAFFVTSWVDDEINNMDDMNIMYTRGESDGVPEVEVKISPTLSKIGDADGRHFDKDAAMVICKPMVTVIYV